MARWKWSRVRIAGVAACALAALAVGFLAFVALTAPPASALREYRAPQASVVLDKDGKLLARLAPETRIVVPISAMSPILVSAFLSVEDQRFFEHAGIDLRRVLGALWHDLRTLSAREGSSTITMQLARNVFPDRLTRARSLRRKLAEMLVARRIEREFSKLEILELYLNQIYLGNGSYGVEAASRAYFGHPAQELTLAEAALLAALPKAPSNYDPRRYEAAALKRRNLVITLMEQQKIITPEVAAAAKKSKIRLKPPEEEGGAPWFVAAVRRELHDRFGAEAETLGLRVRTTLDLSLQRAAERELKKQLELIEKGKLGKFPHGKCGADPDQCLEGLFVALDARTGDVRALVGGRDYELSEFDRVTQARRQPGSAFKPIVWAAALQSGVTIPTRLDTDAMPKDYAPADGQAASAGPLDLREALRLSSNRAAVALGQRVGQPAVAAMAGNLGIRAPIANYPSSFLGASAVVPIELVSAFAAFANGGERIAPKFIDEVSNAVGEAIGHEEPFHEPALRPGVAWLMADLLSDVVERGTGQPARAPLPPGLPVLGKTGTTNRGQDVWFIGATPELVAGVWFGFDKVQPIGPQATGGRLAAPVFGRVLGSWYQGRKLPDPISPPSDVQMVALDSETGGAASSSCPSEHVVREWFLDGTVPAECPRHKGSGLAGFLHRTFGDWLH